MEVLVVDFEGGVVALVEFVDSLTVDVEAGDGEFFGEFDGEREAYVSKADHADLCFVEFHVEILCAGKCMEKEVNRKVRVKFKNTFCIKVEGSHIYIVS